MTEMEMEGILWNWPQEILKEPLTRFVRQLRCSGGRLDVSFKDHLQRLLVVELKQGLLPLKAIDQVISYRDSMRERFPSVEVRCIVVANDIPESCWRRCEEVGVEWREVREVEFREIADEAASALSSTSGASRSKSAVRSKPEQALVTQTSEVKGPDLDWVEKGYRGAFLVIVKLQEIVSRIDARLFLHTGEVMDGKKARMFSKIGEKATPFVPGINSNHDLLRAELHKYDSVRLSVHMKNRERQKAWEEELRDTRSRHNLAFEVLPPRVGHKSAAWLRLGDLSLRDLDCEKLRNCLFGLIDESFHEWQPLYLPGGLAT
jgi:hypothetical protein